MKIEIKDPCNEDWNNMRIGMRSRHCAVCEKSVMDFTQMNRVEIITYLLENSDKQICGRMNYKQFDFQHEDVPLIYDTLSRKGGNSSFLVMALLSISLVACSDPQPAPKNQKPAVQEQEIGVKGEMPLGKVVVDDTLKSTTKKGNPIPEKEKGEISIGIMPDPYPIVQGDVIVEYPEPKPEVKIDEPLVIAEVMPEFPNGMAAMQTFIQNTIQYPQYEKEAGFEGNVYIRFIVNIDGSLSDFTILRGVTGASGFDKEAKRLVSLMPNWVPGENQGKKVRVYMTIPIKFRLN